MANGPVVGAAIISMVFLASIFSPGNQTIPHQPDVQTPIGEPVKPFEEPIPVVGGNTVDEYVPKDSPPPVVVLDEELSKNEIPVIEVTPDAEVKSEDQVGSVPPTPIPAPAPVTPETRTEAVSSNRFPLISDLAVYLRQDPARAFLIEVGMTGVAIVACLYVYFSTYSTTHEQNLKLAEKDDTIKKQEATIAEHQKNISEKEATIQSKLLYIEQLKQEKKDLKEKSQNAVLDKDETTMKLEEQEDKAKQDIAEISLPKDQRIADLESTVETQKAEIEDLKKKLSQPQQPQEQPSSSLAEKLSAAKALDEVKAVAKEYEVELKGDYDNLVDILKETISAVILKSQKPQVVETSVIDAMNSVPETQQPVILLKQLASELKLGDIDSSDFEVVLQSIKTSTISAFGQLKEELENHAQLKEDFKKLQEERKLLTVDLGTANSLNEQVLQNFKEAAVKANVTLPENTQDTVLLLNAFCEAVNSAKGDSEQRISSLEADLKEISDEVLSVGKELNVTLKEPNDAIVLFEDLLKGYFIDTTQFTVEGLTATLLHIKESHQHTRKELEDMKKEVENLNLKIQSSSKDSAELEKRLKSASADLKGISQSQSQIKLEDNLPQSKAPEQPVIPDPKNDVVHVPVTNTQDSTKPEPIVVDYKEEVAVQPKAQVEAPKQPAEKPDVKVEAKPAEEPIKAPLPQLELHSGENQKDHPVSVPKVVDTNNDSNGTVHLATNEPESTQH